MYGDNDHVVMVDVQAQQANMQAQMAQEQTLAMAKASSEKAERISQAQALKNVARLNNVEIPKAVQPGLEAGAKKAIETVQALVAPTLESVKGGNVNETQTTSTEKTTPTEGINTENQIQHTEPRQGDAETEGEANSNPDIEVGTRVNTKSGKTQYTAKIKKTLDFKRLKALAKKHNGWYSTYRTVRAFLFNDETDRNAFVDDVNKEFFNKEKADTKADTSNQKQDDTSLYEKYKTAINNIIRQYRHGQITKSEAESKKKALQEQLKADAKAGRFASEPETGVFISKALIGIDQILNEIGINNVNESSNNNSNKENKKATSEGGNADRIRKSLIAMATKAWNDNNVHERVSFPPSQKLKAKVKELFEHDIDEVFITSDDVSHIKKHHSENEEKRGQVSLTADDIADIYDTVNDFDSATLEESDKQGNKKMLTVRRDNGKMYSLLIERGTKKLK